MAKSDTGEGDQNLSLKACIRELNELDAHKRRLFILALLASKIDRVRFLETADDGLSSVAESSLAPGEEVESFWKQLSDVVDFPDTGLHVFSSLSSKEASQTSYEPIACVDLVADDSGGVSVSIGQAPPLEGENLLTLAERGAEPVPDSVDSNKNVGSYLSAGYAAALLGVAKSTITRKIDRNEVIGFRAFTNKLRIPKEQFVDGTVVTGIPQILAMFQEQLPDGKMYTNHRGAWNFLSTVVFPGDSMPRPIDRLKVAMENRKSHDAVAEISRVKESLDYGDHI